MSQPAQGVLPIVCKAEPKDDRLTCRAGLLLAAEMFLVLGLDRSVTKHVKLKKRERGPSMAELIQDATTGILGGVECLDDFGVLHADKTFRRMLGRETVTPGNLRKILYRFHDEKLIEAAKAARPPEHESYIPEETPALAGLGRVNDDLIAAVSKAMGPPQRATIDQDATIIEAHKKESLAHYKHGRGYQPTLAYCSELGLIVADQFRDGNVPAGMRNLEVARRAFAALPKSITELYFRGDSACYEEPLLKWLSNSERADGPQGFIGFTISADMTPELVEVCKAASAWQMLDNSRADETVQWSEVEFTPGDWPKKAKPLRYLALRIEKRQGFLFANGGTTKYLAVVTNRQGKGDELIRWHWEKAGTIELVHDVLKNDLAAGTMPCGRFGANAAWLRLNVLAFNLQTALKQIALPKKVKTWRPKRMRLWLYNIAGRIAQSAHQLTLYITAGAEALQMLLDARAALRALHCAAG